MTRAARSTRARRSRVVALVGVGLACLVAASVAPAGAVASTPLLGEGESWPQPMLQQLQNLSASKIKPVEPAYIDVGDEQARTDVADGDADYASVGSPLSAEQLALAKKNKRTIAYVPYAYGAVAMAFSLDSNTGAGRVPSLELKDSTLAKIFTHTITCWCDDEIKAENTPDPGGLNDLKSNGIVSVTRLDSSWTNDALMSYFLADPTARATWNAWVTTPQIGGKADTPMDRWPNDPFTSNNGVISGSKGIIDVMLQLDPKTGLKLPAAATHHITYLAPAWTTKYNAPVVSIENRAGQFVTPSNAGVEKAVEEGGTIDPKTNVITLDFTKMTDPAAYPIPMVEYLAVPTTGLSKDKAQALSKFVTYTLSDAGQKVVADTGYVPVSSELRTSGLKVAAALAATSQQSVTTTTTKSGVTTTTSHVTGTTTDTTPDSNASVDPTLSGTGDGSGGSGGSGLPFTGGPPPAVVLGAVIVLVAAIVGRRHARRARA